MKMTTEQEDLKNKLPEPPPELDEEGKPILKDIEEVLEDVEVTEDSVSIKIDI
jgi:hypothetical protein